MEDDLILQGKLKDTGKYLRTTKKNPERHMILAYKVNVH